MDILIFLGFPLLVIALITVLIIRKIIKKNDEDEENENILITTMIFKKPLENTERKLRTLKSLCKKLLIKKR